MPDCRDHARRNTSYVNWKSLFEVSKLSVSIQFEIKNRPARGFKVVRSFLYDIDKIKQNYPAAFSDCITTWLNKRDRQGNLAVEIDSLCLPDFSVLKRFARKLFYEYH